MNSRDFLHASGFLLRTGFRPGARGFIFLLSHMRSRSSVLSHVIGSNPEVVGYFENHVKLRNRLDLLSLTEKVATLTGESPRGKWVYDKILHTNLTVSLETLRRPDALPVFLVRNPAESIASFRKQLAELAAACERKLVLDSRDLVTHTDEALGSLSRFVGVTNPFTSRYEKGDLTGVRKFGDSSRDIHRGKIVQTSDVPDAEPLPPGNDPHPEATAAYRDYCRLL